MIGTQASHVGKSTVRASFQPVRLASRAAQGGEVSLQLDGGVSIVGLAAAGHRLKVDQPAVATIEESGVVIAMSG